MGKTPSPLTLVVADSLVEGPSFTALAEKGHTIHPLSAYTYHGHSLADAHRILAPTAWRFLPSMLTYLDDIVKKARRVRVGKATEDEL
jgi:hypothetical protein